MAQGKASSKEWTLELQNQMTLEEDKDIYGPIEITEFQMVEDKMYILDSYKSQQAYIFNTDGSRHAFVGGPGQGPGEYRRPGGFCRSGDRLHLTTGRQYLVYDLRGEYLASYPNIITGGIPRRSRPGPDDSAFYTTYSRDEPDATIYQVGRDGTLLKKFSPVDEDFSAFWDRVLPMGLVVVKDHELLQIFIHRYEVKVFGFDGKLKRRVQLASGIYNPPDYEEARNLGEDKDVWSAFAQKYTLVNNFFPLGDGYVTGLIYTSLEKEREVLEFWDSEFNGLGRCLVPEHEMLVGTNGKELVFYNGDTHLLSFRSIAK